MSYWSSKPKVDVYMSPYYAHTKDERRRRLMKVSRKIRSSLIPSDNPQRRTRTHVVKYYKDDIELQGLVFPKIVGPTVLNSHYANRHSSLRHHDNYCSHGGNLDQEWLKYFRYRAIEHFCWPCQRKETAAGRGNRASDVATQLATITVQPSCEASRSSFTALSLITTV